VDEERRGFACASALPQAMAVKTRRPTSRRHGRSDPCVATFLPSLGGHAAEGLEAHLFKYRARNPLCGREYSGRADETFDLVLGIAAILSKHVSASDPAAGLDRI